AAGADVTAGGAVNVQTQTNDWAGAHTQAPGGGAVVVLGAKSRAVAGGTATSYVGSGAAVHAGRSIAVAADATRSADAPAEANTATTIVNPTADADVGAHRWVSVLCNVAVQATVTPEGDALTTGADGGGVSVAGSLANDNVNPTATAYIGANTTLSACGSLTV